MGIEPLVREEDLDGPDGALTEMIERQRVIGQHLPCWPVRGAGVREYGLGIGTVLGISTHIGADAGPGGVIEELIDGGRLPTDQVVFKSVV